MLANAQALADGLLATGAFEALHDRDALPGRRRAREATRERHDVYALSDRLRERGWIVPAYSLPPDAEHVEVLRMVVKENFSRDMVDLLLDDVRRALADDATTSRASAPAKGERAPAGLLSAGDGVHLPMQCLGRWPAHPDPRRGRERARRQRRHAAPLGPRRQTENRPRRAQPPARAARARSSA